MSHGPPAKLLQEDNDRMSDFSSSAGCCEFPANLLGIQNEGLNDRLELLN